ncbi:MAG TPA: tRNA uridine-5-carboxymethylaminomethyl(34) synthesis GTPase MnmE [Clostridiales bacterium]|nr:tRNA uridine-5-carboxymethylaminomethyl(34) synthesis GTPase MnmE [Clostridiales bacterium]
MSTKDTIVAKATADAMAAIGIIRISGQNALSLAKEIFTSKEIKGDIEARRMYLGQVSTKNFKDKAFCVYYKAPHSYTGEDVIEFQAHGGKTLLDGIFRELVSKGARPAEPGEFTKRAYLNGKVDLASAEGICDMISADSEAEIMQAYRLMQGELSKTITASIEKLTEAVAGLEASLDYPEELEEDTRPESLLLIKEVKKDLEKTYASSKNRRYITDGINISLCGLTNVGKSSLMNAILNDDRAIVTDVAGTTRDVLKETFMIDGIKVNLVDTAGIRESSDNIEQIGIKKAKEAIKGADVILFVMDTSIEETDEEKALYNTLDKQKTIRVANKGDILKFPRNADILIEAETGKNIEKLMDLILEKINVKNITSKGTLTRERHIFAIQKAIEFLDNAIAVYDKTTIDCILIDLKGALRRLADITGEDVDESIVDKVFSKFCVGK